MERVAGQLASLLAQRRKYELTWVASNGDPLPPASDGLRLMGLPANNFLEGHGFPWPIWPWRSLGLLRRAIVGADIVHFHDFIYFGSLAAFAIARMKRKPIVITQHIGDIPYRSFLLRSTIRVINRTIGRLVLGKADQVVFISEAVLEQFSSFTKFRRRPVRIPNGVDTSTFFPAGTVERERLRNSLGLRTDQRAVLYVGRFVDKKGLPLLHALAAAMPDLAWWFAGWGPRESASHPSNWNLAHARVFEGRSGAALADLYRAADMLVLPSMSEGFPLVVQEAMGCGTRALVATAIADGAPEAGTLLLTCPICPPEMAVQAWQQAIRSALADPVDEKSRIRLADVAKSHWAWDHAVARYEQLFDSLLRRNNAG